jgi:plastocyanin
MSPAHRTVLLGAGGAALLALAGCSAKSGENADLVTGKQLFVKKCGSCHVLARAGTKGTIGPNLDEAFQQPVKERFGASAIQGMVRQQIQLARQGGVMPANLVTGQRARDVAAYVAQVVAQPGKDVGLLATAVQSSQSRKPAVEKAGALNIPADPNGQLAFVFRAAQGTAGKITLDMPNQSGVMHNIAIQGKGAGKIVAKGTSSFSATFTPGTYTYFCEVPGHREAGMVGKLVVK